MTPGRREFSVGYKINYTSITYVHTWPMLCYYALITDSVVLISFRFLDKVYCLSSSEALVQFTRNPRAYLLPPQPRIPCKVCIIGPPTSGKTSLAEMIAQHYNATVNSQCVTYIGWGNAHPQLVVWLMLVCYTVTNCKLTLCCLYTGIGHGSVARASCSRGQGGCSTGSERRSQIIYH